MPFGVFLTLKQSTAPHPDAAIRVIESDRAHSTAGSAHDRYLTDKAVGMNKIGSIAGMKSGTILRLHTKLEALHRNHLEYCIYRESLHEMYPKRNS